MTIGSEPRLGAVLGGHRLERIIGRGGMSVVYLAEDSRLGRKVALKVLAPELAADERFRERFLRESRIAASLDHLHIVPVYEAGEADGHLYIAMRYVEGRSLKELIREEGRLTVERAVDVAAQVADALDHAHARGLVHRDVKPGNVLVPAHERGTVYLADFGTTRPVAAETSPTHAGGPVGTADYMAPEQIERGKVDQRADVYALGCLLFECLTGRPPFQSESLMALLWAHLSEEPPRASELAPDVPRALDTVIARALAKSADDRYDSCGAFVEDVRTVLGTSRLPARLRLWRWRGAARRRRALALGAAAPVALAVVVTAVIYTRAAADPAIGSAENPITILSTWLPADPEHQALLEVLRTFTETTGIHARPGSLRADGASSIRREIEAIRPTIAFVPAPGVIAELARDGRIEPLASLGLTEEKLRQSYGRTWLDLATVGDDIYGFPVKANSKSLLWHRPDDLARMGLTLPQTWRQLTRLTKDISRAGERAWFLSAEDAWTLTDWFENVYLQLAGPRKYDRLFAGKLGFDDPSVAAALTRMVTLLSNENVAGGIRGALTTGFDDVLKSLFGRVPRAQLYLEGGFVGNLALAYIDPPPQPGRTIAAAAFPPMDPAVGSRVVVGADFAVALEGGEAVASLLRFLSSPGAGRIWVSTGWVVSPHRGVGSAAYPNALVRGEARQLRNAQAVRFDGSDLLPGTLASEFESTLQQVVAQPARTRALLEAFERKAASALGNA